MNISSRARLIAPFYVMELLEKASEMEARGEHIVHMEVGEPDFPTPRPIKETALLAIEENKTFYTHSLGLPELRERIARFYRQHEGLDIPPERIVITNGTSGALLLLFASLVDQDQAVALSDPGYPCYRNFGLLFGAKALPIPVGPENNYKITPEDLRRQPSAPQVLVIANPANPTGTVYDQEHLAEIHRCLAGGPCQLIVDEIYSGLHYGRRPPSALCVSDDIIVVNGFSKTYAMTGWRLGWMVVPRDLVRPVQKIAQNVYISPPTISQHAAIAAFETPKELEFMRGTYRARRDFLLPRLRGLGFEIPVDPEGAFYIYAGIGPWNMDSMDFALRALEEAKVAITPGYDFGSYQAGSHVRFTYTKDEETLRIGCERLERWLRGL